MRLTVLLAALVVLTVIYLFWSRNVITRVPGYTTPIGQTPTILLAPSPSPTPDTSGLPR